ncbi:hypothetical protein L208DRAFT_484029 [Tricholoma matsutake]|nr:hypothetical protein L208DRAFT_484029 [Tricholoma matsutake 945]
MWVPSLLVLTVRRRRWSLSLCRCVVHSRCHHRCPLSVFHPQSTPRAVARGAGCGWCVVRSRSRHRWLAVVGVHVHEHFVRNCFVLPGFPSRGGSAAVSDVAPVGASTSAYLAGIPLHGSPGTPQPSPAPLLHLLSILEA